MKKKILLLFFLLGILIIIPQPRSSAVTIEFSNPPESQQAVFSFLDKILADDLVLDSMPLKVGETEISYTEERFSVSTGGKIIRKILQKKDYEREIALKLLNTVTGETTIIKITKKGGQLIIPSGYQIEVVTRPSGITWNAWNTFYKVLEPTNQVVIKNSYPAIKSLKTVTQTITDKTGKKKKIIKRIPDLVENVIYVPYSDSLKNPEIQLKGKNDLVRMIESARQRLEQRMVYSKAVPGKLVTQVLPAEYYWRRPIIEQSDYGEFVFDSQGTVERFLVILATNPEKAWSETCNKAGACGLYQFTDNGRNGTYRTVVKKFPEAQLIKDFTIGASDHINSAMAAMLLDDLNLAELVRKYGTKILNDPKLEEYLAASYNGAPRWVHQSLNATLGKPAAEWGKYLKKETKEFMVKLRYLTENNLP